MADFKITYKGTDCRGTSFIYVCPVCGHEQNERHPAKDNPGIHCNKCQHFMDKKITAPALDADFHDGMLSHNIGWPTDEQNK